MAIARMMLVSIWHILSKGEADRHAIPEKVAWRYLQHTYDLGKANREKGVTCQQVVREKLDRLGIGQDLKAVVWTEGREVRLPEVRIG